MSRDPVHERAVGLVADYAAGRLAAAERREVAAHLGACTECAGLAEAYALLATGSAGGAAAGDHLSSETIAGLAVVPGAVPEASVARHLASCPACAADLNLAREANRTAVARPAVQDTRWLLPLAAAFAVALLGLATMRLWQSTASRDGRIAALETDNAALRTQVADLSDTLMRDRAAAEGKAEADGAVPYLVLHGTVRGAAGPDRLALDAGHTSVYLALAVEIPALARRAGEDGRVVVRDAEGRGVWESQVPGAVIDRLLARGDALLLRIPAAAMEPGRHEIRLMAGTSPPERVWFRSGFEVSGPGPSRCTRPRPRARWDRRRAARRRATCGRRPGAPRTGRRRPAPRRRPASSIPASPGPGPPRG